MSEVIKEIRFPVKDRPDFDFNANLLTSYAEVLLGNVQRIEDTKPSSNRDESTGRVIENYTLLIGFVFKHLVGCADEKEAFDYYNAHKEEMNDKYCIERLLRKVQMRVVKISPRKKLQLVLYLYYNKTWDYEFIKNNIISPKIRRN